MGKTEATELGMEDSTESPKLSEKTIKKFEELNARIEAEEEIEDDAKYMPARKGDEGIDPETGELLIDQEAEKEKLEKESKPEKPEEQPVEPTEGKVEEQPIEPAEGKVEEPTGKKEREIALPNRLIQAGYRHGLSDDDIINLGDRAEPVLSKMADNADKVSTQLGELGRLKKDFAEKKEPPEKFTYGEADQDELYQQDERFDKTAAAINKLQAEVASIKEMSTKREADAFDATIDSFLDNKVTDFPELGQSASLAPEQQQHRKQIALAAQQIQVGAQMLGTPTTLTTALEQAFSIYESQNIKRVLKTKLVKNVEGREKQLTARPSHRRTEEYFKSPRKRAEAKYKEAALAKGLSITDEDEL